MNKVQLILGEEDSDVTEIATGLKVPHVTVTEYVECL